MPRYSLRASASSLSSSSSRLSAASTFACASAMPGRACASSQAGGAAGAAADALCPAAEAGGALREDGAVQHRVAGVLEEAREGMLEIGCAHAASARGLDEGGAVVFARRRRQPVVAVAAGEAQDVGVGYVWVGEADDEAALSQEALRLLAPTVEEVGEADAGRRRRTGHDRLGVVGRVRLARAHDAVDELRDRLGRVDDDRVVVEEGEGAGPVVVVDRGVGEAAAEGEDAHGGQSSNARLLR